MNQSSSFLKTALKGMAMGMAEVIPGVSGGTIAFITGIYERLLNAIKAIGPDLFVAFRKDGIKGAWQQIDGNFLLSLVIGMAAGIVIGVLVIAHLLEEYPPIVWGFFFGLIIASAIYLIQQVSQWGIWQVLGLVVGAIAAYYITTVSPANGIEALWFVFLCGTVAISALILPGISGSFILLILGMYTYIVTDTLKAALTTLDPAKILVMVVFALGCLTGLATISRVLSWTFKYYRNLTLATLTGFIIGSLNKIWPWRNPIEWLRDADGNIIMEDGLPKKILMDANVLPANYEGEAYIVATVISVVVGFAVVFLLERLGRD
jgi:putative membrane protein